MSRTFIRIVASDVPRDTLKALLTRCRQGRKGSIMLTGLSTDGYYYAAIENEAIADTFRAVLTELVIGHSEIDADTMNIQATPPERTASPSNSYMQRRWTGDDRVDDAISDFLTDLFKPKSGPFA